jgi:histidine decarboxylase
MGARSLALADHAIEKFRAAGIPAWRHPNSITVVFPRPSPEIFARWQLAPQGGIAHLIAVPSMTAATIDAFVADVAAHPPVSAPSPASLARA